MSRADEAEARLWTIPLFPMFLTAQSRSMDVHRCPVCTEAWRRGLRTESIVCPGGSMNRSSLSTAQNLAKSTLHHVVFCIPLPAGNRSNTPSSHFVIRSDWYTDKDQEKRLRVNRCCPRAHSARSTRACLSGHPSGPTIAAFIEILLWKFQLDFYAHLRHIPVFSALQRSDVSVPL